MTKEKKTPEEVCELAYRYSAAEQNEVGHCSNIMRGIMGWLFEGDKESITKFYEIIDESKLNLLYLSAVARAASGHGEQISTWEGYRLRALASAEQRFPEKYKAVFAGLLKPDKYRSGTEGAFDRVMSIHPNFVRD